LQVLGDLGVIEDEGGESTIPMLELWNKWDLLDEERREELAGLAEADLDLLPVSAVTGFGIEPLLARLGDVLTKGARLHTITVPASDGARIAWLHQHGEVMAEEEVAEGGGDPQRRIDVRLTDKEFGRFEAL